MNSHKERIVKFLEEHISFFFNHLCLEYPLSEYIIEKYKNQLDWELLSSNEHLKWSDGLIGKFENYWIWESLSGNENLPWSDNLIIKYSNKWNWKEKENVWDCCLSENKSVKWSFNVLKEYQERIDWGMISGNTELLNKYPEILKEFPDRLNWDSISGNEFLNFNEDLIEIHSSYWNWDILCGNRAINWTKDLINKYQSNFNFETFKEKNCELWLNNNWDYNSEPKVTKDKYSAEELNTELKNPEWHKMSYEDRVPWSLDILEKYKDYWDWDHLSLCASLPWSVDLIERFKDRWEWGHEDLTPEGYLSITSGLTINPNLPWSLDLIKKFEDFWYWPDLSAAAYIPWSLELLEEFHKKWIWDHLTTNDSLWAKVFYPYLNKLMIEKLLNFYSMNFAILHKDD